MLSAPATEEPEPTKAPDLMAALEESIAAVQDKAKKGKVTKPKAKKKATPKRAPSRAKAPKSPSR